MCDLLQAHHFRLTQRLTEYEVEYVVIGGTAVQFYCPTRKAADLDIFLRRDPSNVDRLLEAMPYLRYDRRNRARLLSIKVANARLPMHNVDLMAEIPGLDFQEAIDTASIYSFEGCDIPIVSASFLIKHKLAVIDQGDGEAKDLQDLQLLNEFLINAIDRT